MFVKKIPPEAPRTKNRRGMRTRTVAVAAVGAAVIAASAIAWPLQAKTPATPIPSNPAQSMDRAMPSSFADLAERVSPAVVNIQVQSTVKPVMGQMDNVPGNMREFFERYFNMPGMPDGQPGRGQEQRRVGAGSGFVIDAEGHIVTNEHVVHNADDITVTFKDGTEAKAKLVGVDDKTDLALIKIESDKPVPYVKFGKSDDVRVGDWVLTVGNPFGLGHSVNVGVVSARGRTIGAGPYDDFLQIDAQINRGNSGGPAFDLNGNVVGVNAAIFSPNGGNVGIGFAIPSSIAEKVVAELKENGTVERGWLGVSIQPVTKDIAEGLGRSDEKGALISEVSPDSPAAKAGLRSGDVILRVADKEIDKVRELPRVIADIEPGSDVRMSIWRDGKGETVNVGIGRLPEQDKVAEVVPDKAIDGQVGLALKELDPDTARQIGVDGETKGVVVVEVKPGSPASEKGIRTGDVIVKANGRDVRKPQDVAQAIDNARKDGKSSVLALIKRGEAQRFIALPVGTA